MLFIDTRRQKVNRREEDIYKPSPITYRGLLLVFEIYDAFISPV
jgi:hypothetical protein